MEAVLVLGLATLGYYTSEKLNRNKQINKSDENIISENQKPMGKNIMEQNIEDRTTEIEQRAGDKAYEEMKHPYKTGRIGPTFREQRQNKMEASNQDYGLLEKDDMARISTAGETIKKISNELIPADELTDYLTLTDSNDRHSMPFGPVSYGAEPKLVRDSNFSNKFTEVYEGFEHNNMVPFFGKRNLQNMDPYANHTKLGLHTGYETTYKHKKEIEPFYDLQKQHDVFGTPVQKNRNEDRYFTSRYKQSILPFEQKRVAPGLNLGYGEKSNIGFHDTYRPKVKTIDELLVNPKVTYKGRVVGKKSLVSNRGALPKVNKNRQTNNFFTNFQEDFNGDDDTDYRYRPLVKNASSQYSKAKINDKDAVVLKNTERDDYSGRIKDFKGGAVSSTKGNYVYGKHSQSKKQNHKLGLDRVVVSNTVKKSHIYDKDGWKAKTTGREQIAHKTHVFNATGSTKNVLPKQDRAKTTIKEQTLIKDYKGGVKGSEKFTNRLKYHNANSNGLRELTAFRREPGKEGIKVANGKESINLENTRKIQYDTYNLNRRITKIYQPTNAIIPSVTRQKQVYDDQSVNNHRMDYDVVKTQYDSNPYNIKFKPVH